MSPQARSILEQKFFQFWNQLIKWLHLIPINPLNVTKKLTPTKGAPFFNVDYGTLTFEFGAETFRRHICGQGEWEKPLAAFFLLKVCFLNNPTVGQHQLGVTYL